MPQATSPRVIPDPVYLLKGNPAHPEHDELGLRNPEGIEAPDLVLIGGGVVYGAGVRAEQCWPALLQKRMGTGVLNAGMTGWGSVQYALAAEELTTMAPRRVIACLNPASDLIQAFTCASLSDSLLARSFFDPDWTSLPQPDTSATNRAGRAIDRMAAEHPDLADEDILALLAQRGEPDVDPCVLEASRFYLAEHSLLAMQDLEHPGGRGRAQHHRQGSGALAQTLGGARLLADPSCSCPPASTWCTSVWTRPRCATARCWSAWVWPRPRCWANCAPPVPGWGYAVLI